jgi:hypothetical protein
MVKDSLFAKVGEKRNKEFSINCIKTDLSKNKVVGDAIDDFNEKVEDKKLPDWIKKEKKGDKDGC